MSDSRLLREGGALSTSQLAKDAAWVNQPQDLHWLRQNIPCQTACPAGTDIPGYLEEIFHGRFASAYEINLRDNVFPAVLGRVCSRPCEAACRHGWESNGEPVAICFSKRSAADFSQQAPVVLQPLLPDSGQRVAVVGAGVAGLTVARELRRLGHAVTVLEKHNRPGGMLNQGIPAFRLPRDHIEREIEQIRLTGVEILCGVAVGRDISVGQLESEHDALVLAAGTLRPNRLDLPGVESTGIEHGLGFLLAINEHGRTEVGRRVAVIGGGYTAMDCARAALRLGAKRVAVYYRRGRDDMVVLPGELEEFLEEGGWLENACAPVAFSSSQGRVESTRFVRTRPGRAGPDGRRLPIELPDNAFDAQADSVILATGQFPDAAWIEPSLSAQLIRSDGWLSSGTAHATARRKVFAAGDFALGATTLIDAIGHAKACARTVDRFLSGRQRLTSVVQVGASAQTKVGSCRGTGRSPQMNAIPLHTMPTLPLDQRGPDTEVELGHAQPQALAEAARCYLCHYKFEINDAKCVLCDECLLVKPVPGCIVEITALLRDDDGRITGYVPLEAGKADSLYYNRLWIDQNQCVRCGQCEAVCPLNAITIQKVSAVEQVVA